MRRVPVLVLGQVAVLASIGLLKGCGPSTDLTPAANSSADKTGTPAATGEQISDPVQEIEDQLRSALYQLQPENLNIDARIDDATSVLNNWWAAVQTAKLMPTGLTSAELPAHRLTPEELSGLKRDSFDTDDARYIRGCYLAKRIADQLAVDSQSDAERVMRIFEWVCRNITLRTPDDFDYPVTLYEAVIIGRATPRDRANVFGAILKQLRIDSVILSPSSGKAGSSPWLFGVVLQNEILLFDLRLGLPIPRGDVEEAKQFALPATLASLREHPEWLATLNARADQPYEWSADDLQNLRAEAVVTPLAWSHRIWAMEQLLPGQILCVLYDAPDRIDQLPGVFERIAAVLPDTETSNVGVWGYPMQQDVALKTMDVVGARAMQVDMLPFVVPIEARQDKDTKQVRQVETMRQLQIRTEQIYGQRNDAVSQYITIRQLSVTTPPNPALGPVYQRAADDAFYWSCVCKLESGEYESAVRLLNDYLKRYRRGGHWVHDARLLLAEAYVASGDTAEALKTLRIQESNDPYRDRHAILTKAWSHGESSPKSTADE